jgi:hypothetical protein
LLPLVAGHHLRLRLRQVGKVSFNVSAGAVLEAARLGLLLPFGARRQVIDMELSICFFDSIHTILPLSNALLLVNLPYLLRQSVNLWISWLLLILFSECATIWHRRVRASAHF